MAHHPGSRLHPGPTPRGPGRRLRSVSWSRARRVDLGTVGDTPRQRRRTRLRLAAPLGPAHRHRGRRGSAHPVVVAVADDGRPAHRAPPFRAARLPHDLPAARWSQRWRWTSTRCPTAASTSVSEPDGTTTSTPCPACPTPLPRTARAAGRSGTGDPRPGAVGLLRRRRGLKVHAPAHDLDDRASLDRLATEVLPHVG